MGRVYDSRVQAELRSRLAEAEETIQAIQEGAVDAFVMEELGRRRICMLEGSDGPYRLFVDEMEQGVATLHGDGTIVYCNRRLAELARLPYGSMVGRPLRQFVADDDRPGYDDLLREARSSWARGEARLAKGDGSLLPVHLGLHALQGGAGGLVGVFVTDLTEQKQHEALARAQEALREADQRKNEFLAILAHELRNPLAPIRNGIDILRLNSSDPGTVQATCRMLERQVSQIVRLVDDLLDLSRVTRNRIELRKETVELAPIIEQAAESIRPESRALGHHLLVTLPPEPVRLEADPARLTQVFTNLLDNACKYMERKGRIELRAEVSRPAGGGAGEVAVRVRDNGIGIAKDQLSHIFDMFAQLQLEHRAARRGLGIGLTLVSNIVRLHGGRIEATSAGRGQGSEFVVYLPLLSTGAAGVLRRPRVVPAIDEAPDQACAAATVPAEALSAASMMGEAMPGSEAKRYKILVVDDNRDSAESLAILLKLMGHETHMAFDGIEAIAAAEKLRPDVVLLDIGMPNVDGNDACRRMRAQPWAKEMLLIAQTGWGQDEDKRRTSEAGFDGHLVKPVDPEDLLRLVASLRPT
jgi:PAS domain S-box-containing protein